LDGVAIGDTDPRTDIEVHGDLTGPFDGSVDRIAGHGTFIAGLIHQACPDAEIVSWRAIPAEQPLVESEWLTTLAQVIELVRRYRENDGDGYAIDVLSLSMGYYHENDSDGLLDPILLSMIDKLQQLGVAVVCSAGNDATDRPCYPAAFAPWRDGRGPVKVSAARVPLVSVGALNPNTTDALFTNAGTWVRAYAPGAGIMSTMPPFEGGLDPVASTRIHGRVRESIDPDDFRSLKDDQGRDRGGFGLWSGTSFAAPIVAGRIAASMADKLTDNARFTDSPAAARRRAWDAVEHVTGISPTE
jgi:subtilisin family serine protease